MGRRLKRALRIGAAIALAAGCVFAARRIDVHLLATTFLAAALWPFAAAMLLNVIARTAARTRRTLIILRSQADARITFRALFPLLLASYAAGAMLIGPAEELLLGTVLIRRHGFRPASILSAQVTEKTLGILSIAVFAMPLLAGAGWLKVVGAGGTAATLCMTAALAWRSDRKSALATAEAFALVCVSNFLSVVMIALSLRSVGVHLDLPSCTEIFVLTSMASALPIAPLSLGALESAFVFGATRAGISASTALAAALLYHFAQIVPLALAGLPMLLRLTWGDRVRPTTWTGRECLFRA